LFIVTPCVTISLQYNDGGSLIKSFADTATETLFCTGHTRKCPSNLESRALRKLDMVDNARILDDLRVPPGNRLHSLRGKRLGQYSISINDQWRICFKFEEGNAYEVEFCDYH
jgi:proteic killer suppression protein